MLINNVTMATYNKLFAFIVLFCLSQNIYCEDVSDETKDKITEIIGEKQLAIRSYLDGLKLNFQGMEYEIRFAFNKARTDLELEINDLIDQLNTKDAHQKCASKITQEISQKSLTNFDNCALSVKPNLSDTFSSISKYAEFTTKVGEVPRRCIQSHTEVDSIINCVQTSVDEIGKEMGAQQKEIESKIVKNKKTIGELENGVKKCYNKTTEEFKRELEGVKTKCA